MRRVAAVAVLAMGFALMTSGCGVQPTGVISNEATPFVVSQPSSPQSASQSQQGYPVQLYLWTTTELGGAHLVTRYVPTEPQSVEDLARLLGTSQVTEDEARSNWTSYVPDDLQLTPSTQNLHEYRLSSSQKIGSIPLRQLECTFSAYWRKNPDGLRPSVQFDYPGGSTNWQDCSDLLGEATVAQPKPFTPGATHLPTGR